MCSNTAGQRCEAISLPATFVEKLVYILRIGFCEQLGYPLHELAGLNQAEFNCPEAGTTRYMSWRAKKRFPGWVCARGIC